MKDSVRRTKKLRHAPLDAQITSDRIVTQRKQRSKFSRRQQQRAQPSDPFLDEATSQKILREAKLQIIDDDYDHDNLDDLNDDVTRRPIDPTIAYLSDHSDDDNDNDDDNESFADIDFGEFDDAYNADGITEDDRQALAMFMGAKEPERRTLADVIMEKFKQQQLEQQQQHEQDQHEEKFIPPGLNEKVVDVYNKVGLLLSRYRSGKIPKPFKVIPALSNWETILYLTKPEDWSPQAVYQATRLFASNLSPKQAQRFYHLVLLDRFRLNLKENRKLNVHLYESLRKSLYKPAAFFKGILLPLCNDACTLREAVVVASLLSKSSVPVLHASAGLLKLATLSYSGAGSIFIRTLVDKKYALPYRVLDALVVYFEKTSGDERQLPVLWHQSLLAFVQRYKNDLQVDQVRTLMRVCARQVHAIISSEVKRELMSVTFEEQSQDMVIEP